MRRLLRAYPTLLRVGLAEAVAYRAEMIVWMLTTTMPLVSLAMWHAAASEAPDGQVFGFGPRALTAYFLAGLIVRQITGSWVVWEMNQDIRTGKLSLRLLRPIHPLVAYSAEQLGALPLRGLLSVPIAVAMLIAAGPSSFTRDPVMILMLVASLVGAWLITFLTMAFIGTLAFFLEQSAAIFEVYLGAFFVLSGYLFPLDFLSARAPWVLTVARSLPFYYTNGFSIELMIGHHDRIAALRGLGAQWAYVVGLGAAVAWLWRRAMRRYSAVGA